MKRFVLPTLLLLVLFSACKQPLLPEYAGVENIRMADIGVKESVVSADIKYFNPNPFPMKLKEGEVGVYINDRFVGKTILDTAIAIPAKDSFLIPVSMKLDTKQVFSNALSAVLAGSVKIKLEGFARVGRGFLTMKLPVQYEGEQKLDLHF
jgi:LEA14-like dessication related protein